MDNISPEEKLLRLIRGQKRVAHKTTPLKTESADRGISLKSNKGAQRPQHRILSSIPKFLTVFYLKGALWVMLWLSVCYLIYSFVSPMLPVAKDRASLIKPDKILSPEIEYLTESRPLESYLEAARTRRIFGGSSISAGPEEKIPVSSEAEDAINNLNLVGIILGENPQAIIEDKVTHKTCYLSKGEFVGNFQVQDVKEGKVTLILEGQKFELYL